MKKALLLLMGVSVCLQVMGCGGDGGGVIENHPPQLVSLTADPVTVGPGETATITASATDPDGDVLSYSWEIAAGQIEGTGSQVVWTAPNTSGNHSVMCVVSDGGGESDSGSVPIEVLREDDAPIITSLGVQPSVIGPAGGTVTISAHVVDGSGTSVDVGSVRATVSLDGSVVGNLQLTLISGSDLEGDYVGAYQVAANPTSVSLTYQITATAMDVAGHASEEVAVALVLEGVVSPPPPPPPVS